MSDKKEVDGGMISTARTRTRVRRAVLRCALAVIAAGCSARWGLRTEETDIPLQWPYPPDPAKVTYERALTGLTRARDVGSVLRAIAFGRDHAERNAFVLPVAVATSRDGRIAVADLGRGCVHLYIPQQERYLRLSGAARDRMKSPVGLIFDDEGTLYVSDSTGMLFAFAADGSLLFLRRETGGEPLRRPTGITYSPRRKLLYVVDTVANKVRALQLTGDAAFSFGTRGEEQGSFNFPTHIFRSAAGELYVADSLNFRIQIFDEDGQVLGVFGHHGDGSGDLAMPKGVAVDRDGVVYVVDGLFDNVQLFSRRGEFLLTLGQRGIGPGEFWLPSCGFIDEKDQLYVCDTYNRRVQVFRVTTGYSGTREAEMEGQRRTGGL